jgi:hypothetical protein
MIRITDTPKPKDRFGSIPIRVGKPTSSSLYGPHPPARRPRKSSLWTWLKRIVVLLLWLTLLLGIGSPLLVPYLATALLPQYLAGALNRPVTIARAEFNPLTRTLTLHQLIVGPKLSRPDDPVDPLLSAATISINLAPERLLNGEAACTLAAERFFLHLVRQKDGGYNLGQVLDDLLPALPAIPLRFSCDAFALSNSRLVFGDEQSGKTYLAEELTLTGSPGQASAISLQAKINGVSLTLPDIARPDQAANPLPATPEPTKKEGGTDAPSPPDNPALQAAEAIALVQELSQAAKEHRTPPLAP